jgi:hypothetical protein
MTIASGHYYIDRHHLPGREGLSSAPCLNMDKLEGLGGLTRDMSWRRGVSGSYEDPMGRHPGVAYPSRWSAEGVGWTERMHVASRVCGHGKFLM